MKYNHSILGLLLLFAASCSFNEIALPEENIDSSADAVFYATVEEQPDADTKVYADEDLKVLWNADDRITIFSKNTYNQQYRFLGEDGDNAGAFKKVQTDDYITGNELDKTYAVYPYKETTKISNKGIITTSISAEQVFKEGSFGIGANTMVSATDDNMLKFKNVGGYLSLKFYGEGVSVSSITLKSNNGELIAGDCTVDMSSGLPVSNLITANASDAITMVCDPPIELPAEKTDAVMAIFVLSPGTLTGGITVTVTTSDGGVFEKSTNNKLEIGRSAITRLGALEAVPEYVQPNNVIYYTSSDGEIVIPFAADSFGARIINNEYVDGRGFLTFNADVTCIGEMAYYSRHSLTSIIIPDSVTRIEQSAFNDCWGLTSIVIPENVTSVGEGAFYNCNSLTDIVIPENITSIEQYVFCECDGLTSIVIPNTVYSIGEKAFEACRSLTSVVMNSTTPPTGASKMFANTNNCPIYVPAESVETYKTAQYWSDYADRIQSIPDLSITDLTLDVTELELAKESSYSFTATVYPENSTDKDIVWASSNEAVATITSEGVITALKVGNTTVSAECGGIKAYCSVTVVPKSDPSFYSSTDYSKDGEVILLQQATVGNGINIIFLGDGFLDKDMDNGGKYDQIMRSAMEQFFVYEPYKTFRNRFNVYAVRVVSCNEVYGTEDSNRRLTYNEGNLIYMKTGLCTEYGEVVPNPDNQPLRMAVVCNTENRVGRSICYWNSSGWSCCFVFDAIGDVLNHEFGGHGFANLRDEYVERNETFADFDGLDQDYNKWGWGANVDWRSDPSSIRWNRFLSDSRYEGEGLGIFEGGNLYAYGIYRASENSMMRYNNCPFNAPSREQIYKRIMKYSEGDNWEYNYETFVSYDEGGRIQAAEAFSKNAESSVSKRSPEYIVMDYPPLVIDKDVKVVGVDINRKAQIKR